MQFTLYQRLQIDTLLVPNRMRRADQADQTVT
jgi:hypothetical protein